MTYSGSGEALLPFPGPDTMVTVWTRLETAAAFNRKHGAKVVLVDGRGKEVGKVVVAAPRVFLPYTVRLFVNGVLQQEIETNVISKGGVWETGIQVFIHDSTIDVKMFQKNRQLFSTILNSTSKAVENQAALKLSVKVSGQATEIDKIQVCDHSTRMKLIYEGAQVSDTINELLGTTIKITCHVVGPPPLKLSWSYDGMELQQNQPLLTVDLVPDTEGWYGCTAEREFTSAKSYIKLTGYIPMTTFIPYPRFVVVTAGETVKLKCHIFVLSLNNRTSMNLDLIEILISAHFKALKSSWM